MQDCSEAGAPSVAGFPEAPRYIPATEALLRGWCGPIEYQDAEDSSGSGEEPVWLPAMWCDGAMFGEDRMADWGACYASDPKRLDPESPEVRDHLARRLGLPEWMRDRPGGTEPWVSAGLVACAAAGRVPVGVDLSPWEPSELPGTERGHGAAGGWVPWRCVRTGKGWRCMDAPNRTGERGPEEGDEGERMADAAALRVGCAILLDATTLLLPWPTPDGKVEPRVWRKL